MSRDTFSMATAKAVPVATVITARAFFRHPLMTERLTISRNIDNVSSLVEGPRRSLESLHRHDQGISLFTVAQRDGVTSSWKAHGPDVDGRGAPVTNHLFPLLMISGHAAELTGVQAHTEDTGPLVDHQESHDSAICGFVGEAMERSITHRIGEDRH